MAVNNGKKDKEVRSMACSMAVVPLLNEEATKSLMETLKKSKLKPYTDEQRKATDEAIEAILAERSKNS